MRRTITVIIACMLLLALLPACEMIGVPEPSLSCLTTPEPSSMQGVLPSATPEATSLPSQSGEVDVIKPFPFGRVIVFEDPVVEEVIRAALQKPKGPVTDQDMLEVVSFNSRNTDEKKIKTLDDLRWCVNLMHITLGNTGITDISVLKGMQNLWTFECIDQLDDYTPLLSHKNLRLISLNGVTDGFFRKLIATCSNLKHVYLYQSDVSAEAIRMLADKFELRTLSLGNCGIKDVSPFVGFTGLSYLSLENNLIKDISPLAENTQLRYWTINLRNNKITDWSPLESLKLCTLYVKGNPVTEGPALDELARNGLTIKQ